jgi:endonuclease/exonuclease/phosphatase family metal-dependent hydrolase
MDFRATRILALCALAPALLAWLAAPAVAAKKGAKKPKDRVTLMTRNLYLGSDLTGIFTTTTSQQVADEAGEILNDIRANNFPLRALALANEIRKRKPDLVGLQEVSLVQTQAPPDGPPPPTGTGIAANFPLVDFLDELMKRVNKGARKRKGSYRGYRVVAVEQEADIEAPANSRPGGFDSPPFMGLDEDGRLTDRDVILARLGEGVKVSNPLGGHFQRQLVVPIPGGGGSVTVTRGWNSLDANVRGKRFHLVNTHLEAADAAVRFGQAQEMVAPGGPATSTHLPVILIGDINSDDGTVQGNDRLAYQALLGAGFRSPSRAPFSCCYQTELLTNPGDTFTHQVDHVLTNRGRIRLVRSSVTGTAMFGGYWPSDHGGVVSELRFGK